MSSSDLLQSDADTLLLMEKIKVDDQPWLFPDLGGALRIPLTSQDGRESFSLDISRRRIALTTKYQTRSRQSVVLVRLDFDAPHRNPDDSEVAAPHVHFYREGYGDKWAYPIPEGMLSNPDDAWQVLQDFMAYCKVIQTPNIIQGLFTK